MNSIDFRVRKVTRCIEYDVVETQLGLIKNVLTQQL